MHAMHRNTVINYVVSCKHINTHFTTITWYMFIGLFVFKCLETNMFRYIGQFCLFMKEFNILYKYFLQFCRYE